MLRWLRQKKLSKLYSECFPERNAENELKALGKNFHFEIFQRQSFIIFKIISPDEAEIIDLGTAVEYRNKGLATKTFNNLIERLIKAGIRTVFLEVAENNEAAINLYKKMGFAHYNTRKGYYTMAVNGQKMPIDALLMKKTI